jgi:secernin
MCDTFVALGTQTRDGSVLFAKNSDREPNEAHEVVVLPRAVYPDGSRLRCTYIEIPQAPQTYAVLLSKPFWMWGAEMGSNEHGVTIGNEAVFTRIPYEKGPALTGMDLLRLALERTTTAREALDLIIRLLEQYGQGGNCGFTHPFYYHNSFLIADLQEAWVLETAGKQWAAERVQTTRSISNAITIGSTWDLASEGLVDYALERGWCKNRADFHFGRCYSDKLVTYVSDASPRQCRTTEMMQPQSPTKALTPQDLMQVLRDHGGRETDRLRLRQGLTGCDICMHAGFGPIRINQTTGSMVSHLAPGLQTHWVTATAAPCTSIFKPVWIDTGMPDLGPAPTGLFDPGSLWWQHELLHRSLLDDYAGRLPLFKAERDFLETDFIDKAQEYSLLDKTGRAALTAECFLRSAEAERRWIQKVGAAAPAGDANVLFKIAWKNFNRQAGFTPLPAGVLVKDG